MERGMGVRRSFLLPFSTSGERAGERGDCVFSGLEVFVSKMLLTPSRSYP